MHVERNEDWPQGNTWKECSSNLSSKQILHSPRMTSEEKDMIAQKIEFAACLLCRTGACLMIHETASHILFIYSTTNYNTKNLL